MQVKKVVKRMPEIKPCGWCYFCSSGLDSGELFCDKVCQQWWEKQFEAEPDNEDESN